MIHQPLHAQRIQFLVKEGDTELARKQGHVLNDRKTHAPFRVFGEFDDRRQQTGTELPNSNHFIYTFKVWYDVQTDLRDEMCKKMSWVKDNKILPKNIRTDSVVK